MKSPQKLNKQTREMAAFGLRCKEELENLQGEIDGSCSRGPQMQIRLLASKIVDHPETPKQCKRDLSDLCVKRTPENVIMVPEPPRNHTVLRGHKNRELNQESLLAIMERHSRATSKFSLRMQRLARGNENR